MWEYNAWKVKSQLRLLSNKRYLQNFFSLFSIILGAHEFAMKIASVNLQRFPHDLSPRCRRGFEYVRNLMQLDGDLGKTEVNMTHQHRNRRKFTVATKVASKIATNIAPKIIRVNGP